jgi:hypothetical protein
MLLLKGYTHIGILLHPSSFSHVVAMVRVMVCADEQAGGGGMENLSTYLRIERNLIGFRTSQTTGLGAHLAAPLIPMVEREAIDLQDPTLRVYNTELLEFAGIIMRLTLEHGMSQIHQNRISNTVD